MSDLASLSYFWQRGRTLTFDDIEILLFTCSFLRSHFPRYLEEGGFSLCPLFTVFSRTGHYKSFLFVKSVLWFGTSSLKPMLTKPGSFAIYAANQMLRHWGLQQRKGLFSRQSSEEISLRSTSQKVGTLFIYGIKLRYGECGERWLEMRKKWDNCCSAKA